jgi:hypothetical protein
VIEQLEHECKEGFECNDGKLYAYCSDCRFDGGCGCMAYSVSPCDCICHRNGDDKKRASAQAQAQAEYEAEMQWAEQYERYLDAS